MRVAAFFDLDWTLLRINSGMHWVRSERQAKRIAFGRYAEGLVYMVGYRLNLIDLEFAVRRALLTVKNESEDTLRERTRHWYEQHIGPTISTIAQSAVEAHRRSGHAVVLLSSTSIYQGDLVARQLNLDGCLCSHYEVAEGRLTGKPILPLCIEQGKVDHAERFAADRDIDLSRSYFYSDSASDLPMLERVGYPRAVNPDWRLRRVARRRNWPILAWK